MKRLAWPTALCLAVIAGVALASDENVLLQEMAGRLVFQQALEGNFRQEKHLHFMQRPMTSAGTFRMDCVTGLKWQVTDPVESLMTVQGQTVVLDGKPVADQGVGQLMAMIMLGFMDGDLAGLGRSFLVAGEVTDEGWELTLAPDTLMLRSALQVIDLSGDRYLQRIEVTDKSMTRTLISFEGVREVQAVEDADAGPG